MSASHPRPGKLANPMAGRPQPFTGPPSTAAVPPLMTDPNTRPAPSPAALPAAAAAPAVEAAPTSWSAGYHSPFPNVSARGMGGPALVAQLQHGLGMMLEHAPAIGAGLGQLSDRVRDGIGTYGDLLTPPPAVLPDPKKTTSGGL